MKAFAIHSGAIPEPLQTSRARADQGTREQGAGSRFSDLGILPKTKCPPQGRAAAFGDWTWS